MMLPLAQLTPRFAADYDESTRTCQDLLDWYARLVGPAALGPVWFESGWWAMEQRGFAVAGFRDGDEWRCEALPPAVLGDLSVLISALRSQVSDGGPFVIASVDDEFFLIARQVGPRTVLLLSDLTASVEYPLAAQALERLGEDPPEDDELDEVWPVGDLDIFADLGLPEDEMERIVDDIDAYPDEMLESIVSQIDLADAYERAAESVRPAR
jgi:putative tRNA adenosine deaminase-associated protein